MLLLSEYKKVKKKRTLKNIIIKINMSRRLKNIFVNTILGQKIDFNTLASRAYIISKMNKMLSEDATNLD